VLRLLVKLISDVFDKYKMMMYLMYRSFGAHLSSIQIGRLDEFRNKE